MHKVTEQDLDKFVELWQQRVDEHMKERGYNWKATMSYTIGKKYAKIVKEDHGQSSSYGFVDLSNGDVLMSASWQKPAKHARGNIFSEQGGVEALDRSGYVKYLR